jgi:methylated-DNA-[protein]-cysteine S-methyltransferase
VHTLRHHTPAGPLTTILNDDGAVIAAGFTGDADVLAVRAGLSGAPPTTEGPTSVGDAIERWLEGDLTALAEVALAPDGTPFQHQVWAALRQVPPGQTATYSELAVAVGRPSAIRAVGSACGRNLIAPFIPCHRAVRSDGSLGGYYYGTAVKQWLLGRETGHSTRHASHTTTA